MPDDLNERRVKRNVREGKGKWERAHTTQIVWLEKEVELETGDENWKPSRLESTDVERKSGW